MDVKDLLRSYSKAKADTEEWRDLLEDAYDYTVPERNNFSTKTEGDEENGHIYDETASLAAPRYANRMQRTLFPDSFVKFQAGSNYTDEEKRGMEKDLEAFTEAFFTDFNLSNFETEINPSLIDNCVSTGVIQIDENKFTDDIAFHFTCIPANEIHFCRPVQGRLVNMFRDLKMEASQIQKTWPKANIPHTLAEKIKKDPYCEEPLILSQRKEDNEFKISVIWDKNILWEESYDTQRIIAFRLNAFPKETRGRGPAILALPAIRNANSVKQLILENAAISVAGMYTAVSDSVFNPWTFTISAGGVIPVSNNSNENPSLRRLDSSGDLYTGQIVIEDLQDSIRKAFFVDPMGDISDPVRSATEQTMRMQEFLKDQGAAISRLRTELVEPVVKSVVSILKKRGKLPDIKVDGREVKITHNTKLIVAENQEDFQNLMTWAQSVQALVGPEVFMGLVNIEEMPNQMADMLGVSSKMVRPAAQVKELSQQVMGMIGAQQGQQGPAGQEGV